MTTDPLFRAILDNPDDHLRKLIYADHLEELGSPEAKVWRWLGENKKFPHRTKRDRDGEWDWAYGVRREIGSIYISKYLYPFSCWLPGVVFACLAAQSSEVRGRYDTQVEAYQDLISVMLTFDDWNFERRDRATT